jgi:hypothetical protein
MQSSIEDIRKLIERCNQEGLSDGDIALLRSLVMRLSDPTELTVLLDEGVECEPLASAALERYNDSSTSWPTDAMIKLTESLIFHGRATDADELATSTMRRQPGDPYTIRLWAYCANTTEGVISRFMQAARDAVDPDAILQDARDYAERNEPEDLLRVLNRLGGEMRDGD